VLKRATSDCPIGRVPAAEIEKIVIDQVRSLLRSPEVIVQTWRTARKSLKALTESDVRTALLEFDQLWAELFPGEQARIIQLLVERVDVGTDGVDIRLRTDGITSLVSQIMGDGTTQQNAA
jgi:site-specific DNA recombinase